MNLEYIDHFCAPNSEYAKLNDEIYKNLIEFLPKSALPTSDNMKLVLLHLSLIGYNVKHLLNVVCFRRVMCEEDIA